MTFEHGPYLSAAVICERALQEASGVFSLIRMFDRLTQTAVGISPMPATLPPVVQPLTLFVALKSGRARGKMTLSVQVESPDGLIRELVVQPLLFEGDDRGANAVMEIQMQLEQEGVYWFHILLDGQFLTKIPLRLIVLYQQIQGPSAPPAPS